VTYPKNRLDAAAAERFADLALACIHREYPNKLGQHVLTSDGDVRPPRELTPAFYGCFDWHSAVHGHWMLARLARKFPEAAWARRARTALGKSLTAENLGREVEYMAGRGRTSFERPYGLAWLLQLAAELGEWRDAEAWSAALAPLVEIAVARLEEWLRKLAYPVRSGEHSQSAFSLGLMLDYARVSGRVEFRSAIESKVLEFYFRDRGGPLDYEPSGEDFLSPCLAEADVMRRVLRGGEFAEWLQSFLPSIPGDGSAWIQPVAAADPSDPKLGHLDGLNLSRAWMLRAIAAALPCGDGRVRSLRRTADEHARASLEAVTGEHYEGGHWLGTFAVYMLTASGGGMCVWFTGLPCAGKTTLARRLGEHLEALGRRVLVLDGDEIRKHLSADLGFSGDDRHTNVLRVAAKAREVVESGGIAICALVSPYVRSRDAARDLVGDGRFIEVYVNTPAEICEGRDVKGMYRLARDGKISHFTGVDDPYEAPPRPELVVEGFGKEPAEVIAPIVDEIERRAPS
jgi:adenylyl-sulfate kinase